MLGNKALTLALMLALQFGLCPISHAQWPELTYTTEMQTDFGRGVNWVNLLRTEFTKSLTERLDLQLATITTAKTRKERLANDLQTFSNIEENNLPLALAVMGLSYCLGASSLFAGIRNLNEDYFTSPCTSLFTNSSCGIFPTISISLPIANYPLSSVGFDYKLQLERFDVEASLYNGTGYKRFGGRNNMFRFCPASDGLFFISATDYHHDANLYHLGFAVHSGRVQTDASDGRFARATNVVTWAYAEQHLCADLFLTAHASVKPTGTMGCRSYFGGGIIVHVGNTEGGLFTDYADCYDNRECACELTWKIPLEKHFFFQPVLHFIKTNDDRKFLGVLRLGFHI